jgi:hypothetical protein
LTPISFKKLIIRDPCAVRLSDVSGVRAAGALAKRQAVLRAPCGIERLSPCCVENADESERADDEQRPLQNFRARRVDTQMIEQCQVGERPERHEPGPVDENRSDGDSCARLSRWSARGAPVVLPFARWLMAFGSAQSNAARAGRGICCQWKSVRHDPCPLAAIQIAVLEE